jgi:hypothetical protein
VIGETKTLGETVPRTCPVCGDEPVAVVHDTGTAARPYEVTGGYCTVRDTEVDTAHMRDRLSYVHD